MKQSTLLVGGGVIARHYKTGLDRSQTLRLSALVDIDPDCAARSEFSVPFYTNVADALGEKPKIALLALSLAARGEIARRLLSEGVAVFTEKPMLASLDEIQSLFAFAEECKTPLACLYHWKAADEVRFLKSNPSLLGKITAISTTVNDDYAATPDGTIRADRVGLMGAWIDSGINVLSFYDELIDLSDAALQEERLVPDGASGLCKYVRKRFFANGVTAEITVDWTKPDRSKTSTVECERGTLTIDHTAQTIRLNGQTVYANPVADRLSSHYENLFRELSFEGLAQSKERTLMLHKLLFTGNAR